MAAYLLQFEHPGEAASLARGYLEICLTEYDTIQMQLWRSNGGLDLEQDLDDDGARKARTILSLMSELQRACNSFIAVYGEPYESNRLRDTTGVFNRASDRVRDHGSPALGYVSQEAVDSD